MRESILNLQHSIINQFLDDWILEKDKIYHEHIDYFANQKLFTYEECLKFLNVVCEMLNSKGIRDIQIVLKINCGSSKRVQNWENSFWQLVDYSLTPPELFLGQKVDVSGYLLLNNWKEKQKKVKNYISFDYDQEEERYFRYLVIVKEV
ncbi:hypothetical protein [Pseudolactococcus yaeyamensis]